jgi:hypothetical protein
MQEKTGSVAARFGRVDGAMRSGMKLCGGLEKKDKMVVVCSKWLMLLHRPPLIPGAKA